jgi:hypothetical protein
MKDWNAVESREIIISFGFWQIALKVDRQGEHKVLELFIFVISS